MMNNINRLTALLVLVGLGWTSAHAVEVTGDILRDPNDLFSFAFDPLDSVGPLFFAEDAQLEFSYDFNTGIASVTQVQFFLLESTGGDAFLLTLFDLTIDTNDTDGFLGATANIDLDGVPNQVEFPNANLPGTDFNSTSIENGQFSAFIAGGASASGLRVNLAFTGFIGNPPPPQVAEPSVLALFACGVIALGFARRR